MDNLNQLWEQGVSVVALVGVSYYVIRLTNFLFRTLAGGLDEHTEITIKQIDALNQIRGSLCEVNQQLAELKEQHRNYHDLFILYRDRVQESDEHRKRRPRSGGS